MATAARPLAAARSRRVVLVVALAALVAAAAVVAVTVLQTRGQSTTVPGRVGPPVLQLELGLRTDPEARALARAQQLLDNEHPRIAEAASIFSRYRSFEAQLGLAFARWDGPSSLTAVKELVARHPNDPVALLNLGWADYQAGRDADAASAWRETATRYPDSPYGVDAEDALHQGPAGLPPIVLPAALARLAAKQSFADLRRGAEQPGVQGKLLYGVALWNLKRPVSAERELAAAAKLAPHDPLAQTLAAVSRFSKASPTRAFARLGPLTAVFPHSPVVELHLGLLLIYIDENAKAAEHLRAAIADGPRTPYAADARLLLASLERTRSK